MKLRAIFPITLTLILSLSTFHASAQINDRFDGKWENNDSLKLISYLSFIDSSGVYLALPGQGTIECIYKTDTSKDPIWFDLFIKSAGDDKVIKGLIKFIDENTMKWELFWGSDRPADFTNETKENTVILKRKR